MHAGHAAYHIAVVDRALGEDVVARQLGHLLLAALVIAVGDVAVEGRAEGEETAASRLDGVTSPEGKVTHAQARPTEVPLLGGQNRREGGARERT